MGLSLEVQERNPVRLPLQWTTALRMALSPKPRVRLCALQSPVFELKIWHRTHNDKWYDERVTNELERIWKEMVVT
jgi:hypothetical protein